MKLVKTVVPPLLLVAGSVGMAAGPASAAVESCNFLSNGTLCANVVGDGYRASYAKSSGSTIKADFNLVCANGAVIGSQGPFYISAGQMRSYVFQVSIRGDCRVRLYDVTNGKYYYTGYVTR